MTQAEIVDHQQKLNAQIRDFFASVPAATMARIRVLAEMHKANPKLRRVKAEPVQDLSHLGSTATMVDVLKHPAWVAFIAAIRAAPGDVHTRMALLEWLEQTPASGACLLADFIRVVVMRKEKEALLGVGSAPWWQGPLVKGKEKKEAQKELNDLTSLLRKREKQIREKQIPLPADEFRLLRWKAID